ncbi:hypothetical protein [Terrimonas pollutisoli]|uniref:hypothetical protein n=1 Tax=Terrimonas pollutisoli TaxID=3034147 RepID=UPI0023EBE4DD|nr:hypothetical protein [Terrimonas sp. H1YJ31]
MLSNSGNVLYPLRKICSFNSPNVTHHFIQQGYKRIAHITSSGFLFITIERMAGYIKAFEENNIMANDSYIKYCAHGGMITDEIYAAVCRQRQA